jgi:hypothetical protein
MSGVSEIEQRVELLALRALVVRLLAANQPIRDEVRGEIAGGATFWPNDAIPIRFPSARTVRQSVEDILKEAEGRP